MRLLSASHWNFHIPMSSTSTGLSSHPDWWRADFSTKKLPNLRIDLQICPPKGCIFWLLVAKFQEFHQPMWWSRLSSDFVQHCCHRVNFGHKRCSVIMCYLENAICTWQLTYIYNLTWMSYFVICHHQPYLCFSCITWLCTTMWKIMPNCIVNFVSLD